ncbi:MAG: MBL fold metallo-hydrolase [Pseudomonadota bacterium]
MTAAAVALGARLAGLATGFVWVLWAGAAAASICHAFVQDVPGVRYAQLGPIAQAPVERVHIEFVAHSTFRITTPAGVVLATDYSGYHGQGRLPDVVTMNNAHSTHYTDYPDPAIGHVLRGWNPSGDGPAEHMLELEDVVVRNVTTDIRSGFEIDREPDGNSIFVFEVAGICIGHLGHLHHTLSDAHYAMLGRMDVVMAPVDGTYTLNTLDMIEIMKKLRASIVLPMHAFGPSSMRFFLDGMADAFEIRRQTERAITVDVTSLPAEPTVVLLGAGGYFFDD